MFRKNYLAALALLILLSFVGTWAQAVERNPVIIIPGVAGTELVDASGKTVWFSIKRQ